MCCRELRRVCARTGIDHAHFLAERLERALIHGAVAALAARVALEHVLNMVQTEQARHALERALVQRVPQRPPERVRPRRHRCPAPRGWSHGHLRRAVDVGVCDDLFEELAAGISNERASTNNR